MITMMHKYPYLIGTFIENSREYGLRAALKEDLFMTKEKALRELEELVVMTITSVVSAVSVPIIVYHGAKYLSKEKR